MMEHHSSFSPHRQSPQQRCLPQAPSFPAQLPERLRSAPRPSNSPQLSLGGHDFPPAKSPQEVPIVCENMFEEKQPVGGTRVFLPGGDNQDEDKPVKRRMRGITSCLECRRRKMKCGRTQPCDHCSRSNRVCIYLGDRLDPDSQNKITEIKERVSSLELQLQKSVVHQRIGSGLLGSDVPSYSLDPAESGLEISYMVTSDLIYDHADQNNLEEDEEDEDEATNDMIDLGFKVGRMRMTERIGGLNRPRLAEEINIALSNKPGSFGFNMESPASSSQPQSCGLDANRPIEGVDSMGSHPDGATIPEFLRPSSDYIAPSSSALFGLLTAVPPVQKLLPSAWICNFLKNTYFTNVHPIAACLHKPSFEQQFGEFLDLVGRGRRPCRPRQALVFAVLFSGVVAADADEITAHFNIRKIDLVALIKYGVEASLGKANLLRTTSVEAIQAFVIYLVALCRDEVSRAHSILVGAAIRMAECMALHRDGSAFGLTALETHVRRLIWHQLCFLDIRTCEAQGPRPAIQRDEYDTFLPYNCRDEDVSAETDAAYFVSKQSWTASFLSVLRFEVNEMMRIIWADRFKLERRKIDLAAVMDKIEKFCRRLNQKYEGYLDDGSRIKRYTKLVKELFICRMHVMVLHPYHSNTINPLSERLHSTLIQSGIRIVEIGIELETNPEFSQWRWYLGAFMQYQIALLLTTEAFHGYSIDESNRISKCLEYVFGAEPSQSLYDKAHRILYEVMHKSATYCEFRKLRAPTITKQAVPQVQPTQQSTAGHAGTLSPNDNSLGNRSASRDDMTEINMIKNEASMPIMSSLPFVSSANSAVGDLGAGSSTQLQLQPQSYEKQGSDGNMFSSQQQKYNHYHETINRNHEGVPQAMAPMAPAREALYQAPYDFNQQSCTVMAIDTDASGNSNMVFSGVANGEALWGHPQAINTDSPDAFGGEWASLPVHPQPQLQPQQQAQPQFKQEQQYHEQCQEQYVGSFRHPYPYAPANRPYQEYETNVLGGIIWDDLNSSMLPKNP